MHLDPFENRVDGCVAIRMPEWQVRKASYCGSKQQ